MLLLPVFNVLLERRLTDLAPVPILVLVLVLATVDLPGEFVLVEVAEGLAIVRGSNTRALTQHWLQLSPHDGNLLCGTP